MIPDRWAMLLHGISSSQILDTFGENKKQANQWLASFICDKNMLKWNKHFMPHKAKTIVKKEVDKIFSYIPFSFFKRLFWGTLTTIINNRAISNNS